MLTRCSGSTTRRRAFHSELAADEANTSGRALTRRARRGRRERGSELSLQNFTVWPDLRGCSLVYACAPHFTVGVQASNGSRERKETKWWETTRLELDALLETLEMGNFLALL